MLCEAKVGWRGRARQREIQLYGMKKRRKGYACKQPLHKAGMLMYNFILQGSIVRVLYVSTHTLLFT